ncbi:MAG: hypothetical protein R3A52_32425 [Polyangiales bacterium]
MSDKDCPPMGDGDARSAGALAGVDRLHPGGAPLEPWAPWAVRPWGVV